MTNNHDSNWFLVYIQIIEDALGGKIHGELDKSESGIIYTEAYVCRYICMCLI